MVNRTSQKYKMMENSTSSSSEVFNVSVGKKKDRLRVFVTNDNHSLALGCQDESDTVCIGSLRRVKAVILVWITLKHHSFSVVDHAKLLCRRQ